MPNNFQTQYSRLLPCPSYNSLLAPLRPSDNDVPTTGNLKAPNCRASQRRDAAIRHAGWRTPSIGRSGRTPRERDARVPENGNGAIVTQRGGHGAKISAGRAGGAVGKPDEVVEATRGSGNSADEDVLDGRDGGRGKAEGEDGGGETHGDV